MSPRFALIAVLTCSVFVLVLFRPIHDVDMFWQVRTGELMLETGQLVQVDPFSSTHRGEPTPTIYWLSQLFYALLLRMASWELLHRLDALFFALSLGLAALSTRENRGSVLATLFAFGVGLLTALPHQGLRPQTFGLLGFALVLAVLQSHRSTISKVIFTFIICLLWQNLHPSVSLGVLALGTLTLAQLLKWWWRRETVFPRAAIYSTLVAGLAMFLTPDGFGILSLSAQNATISKEIGVEEWLPSWNERTFPASRGFWIGLVCTGLLMLKARKHVQWEDVAITIVMTVAALAVYRMSLFWVVVMIPIWIRWVNAVFNAAPIEKVERLSLTNSLAILAGITCLLVVMLGIVRPPVFDSTLPFAGLKHLKERQLAGTVYNYREWGGPLIWSTHPELQVVIDGRLYLYSHAEWESYIQAARGETPLSELEARYHPQAFFLRPSYHEGLIEILRQSQQWKEVYLDEICVIFIKSESKK